MLVIGITGVKHKRTLLVKCLLILLLILTLLPALFGDILPAMGEQEITTIVPGEPIRVSLESDAYWQNLLTAWQDEAGF